jgi:phospholipase/carboxylesterase
MKNWFQIICCVMTATAISLFDLALASGTELPIRKSPRPVTTNSVPHVQIDVEVVPELKQALLRRVQEIPDVEVRETVISLPGTKGFWISDQLPLKRPEAIVGGREFAHVHPDGSLHAALNPVTAKAAIKAGWAVYHPWSSRRPGWEGFVMIYTPLTEDELNVVFQLVMDSYNYVTGRELD